MLNVFLACCAENAVELLQCDKCGGFAVALVDEAAFVCVELYAFVAPPCKVLVLWYGILVIGGAARDEVVDGELFFLCHDGEC